MTRHLTFHLFSFHTEHAHTHLHKQPVLVHAMEECLNIGQINLGGQTAYQL